MFRIWRDEEGSVHLAGRLTAVEADDAREFLAAQTGATVLDFAALDYISSAGLGILIDLHHRLAARDAAVRFRNLNRNIAKLFEITGFDTIFEIES
jgi:anti-sigma B factor antagonist